MSNNQQTTDTSGRELFITRLLNAPRELVWEVWTNPEHIKNWWGPNGFTNTIHKMDVRSNGEWNLTMHGPDGVDYKNKSIFIEVVKPEKLVYDHVSGPRFLATVIFTEQNGKTLLSMRIVFETADEKEQVVKVFKADEGQKQTINRLEEYLRRTS